MSKNTDVRCTAAELYFLPVETRVPLKFGAETLTSVTCARARLRVEDSRGGSAEGWGETPLSVQWAWPMDRAYAPRHDAMKSLCEALTRAWADFDGRGHPIEIGQSFLDGPLARELETLNRTIAESSGPMPWLAALICSSAFDIALHDAFGNLQDLPVYDTYNGEFMNRDLSALIEPTGDSGLKYDGVYPEDLLVRQTQVCLPAWHLVGGKDPVAPEELTGEEPDDGYPVLLDDWIKRDGLTCLKVKLRGNDEAWDYERIVAVGTRARSLGVLWLTADFNCTVEDPGYVNEILDRLMAEHPLLYQMILYVEQPFPYDLEKHRIDVHGVSARKPLFMDESAHDWKLLRLGRSLGWTGVALKTCKTQTGALLSTCWAKSHGMTLMVQDLTNPMLAQVPHVLLAARAGTIMGVETNAMQFYPDASKPEEAVHPGLYRRRKGVVDLSTIKGSGFGYRVGEIHRSLPDPAASFGAW